MDMTNPFAKFTIGQWVYIVRDACGGFFVDRDIITKVLYEFARTPAYVTSGSSVVNEEEMVFETFREAETKALQLVIDREEI